MDKTDRRQFDSSNIELGMTTSFKVYQIKNGNINKLAKETGRSEAAMSKLLDFPEKQALSSSTWRLPIL